MPQHFPELFRGVRRERREHAHEVFRAKPHEAFVFIFKRIVFRKGVYVFHQSCHRSVEGKRFRVARDVLDGVVARVVQFFFGRAECEAFFHRLVFRRFYNQAFRSFHEFRHRFDTVVVPRSALGVRKAEHQIQAENVGTVLFHVFVGRNHVAFRFAHAVAVRS